MGRVISCTRVTQDMSDINRPLFFFFGTKFGNSDEMQDS